MYLLTCDWCLDRGKLYCHEPKMYLITENFSWTEDKPIKYEVPKVIEIICKNCNGVGGYSWKHLPNDIVKSVIKKVGQFPLYLEIYPYSGLDLGELP